MKIKSFLMVIYRSCEINSATTLMLLLLFCWIPTADSGLISLDCGAIKPIDPYAFIGERLDLTCTIDNISSNQPVQLYFVISVYERGIRRDKKINQTMQLNNTAIRLISPVLTLTDAQNHYVSRNYICMVQQEENECTKKNNKTISNRRVRIDYFPQNPENFSCQVYNWEKLTCWWAMVSYFHKKDIRITHFWKADKNCVGSLLNYTVNESTTTFTIPDFQMEPDYCFYFEIANVVRDVRTRTAVFHISPFNIVKPAPVDFISFQNISDTCVTVVWNHSEQFREQVFRVSFISECSTVQQFHLLERNVTVCGLNPYTNYTFIVDSKPRNMNGSSHLETVGFTSDSRNNTVTTNTTVPAANPKLLSYRDVFCSKSPCRHVLLYWEPLPPCDLHDSPSGQQYEIITKERGSEETRNSTANDSKAISHLLKLPDEEKVYEVKLRVITGTGKKREDFSHLVIWPRNQGPIAPSMVVEYDTREKHGTNVSITLHLTEAQSKTSQILYWCRSLLGRGCQEPMSFRKINGTSAEIFIGNYEMDFNFKFGVESQQLLKGEITRSGIHMASCIYRKDQKPLIPPKNFHIAKGIAEREGELSLQWDPYDCNSFDLESGYVLSYTLFYCQVIDESSCNLNYSMHDLNEISIERDIHNYTVRKLKPGGRYKIWLTARTSAGEGPPTDAVDTYIYLQEFPLWGKVFIGVVSLIASLVILICFVKFQQYLKKRRKAFSMIEIPVLIGHIHQGHGHVIVNDQSDAPVLDMAESEELSRIIPLIPNGNAQVSVTNNSSSTNLLLDLWKGDQIQRQLDISFFSSDQKDEGCYISSNDVTSASSDIESDRDIKDEKDIKPAEFGHQNTSLLPEGYCRVVRNGNYVPNDKTNPMLYEDRLDNNFFKLGQEMHSQSIDSLLNDGPELQRTNITLLDDYKGNICERDEDIDSVCENDSLNLSTKNVTIEKQIGLGWMKSNDDSESDESVLSGDDLDDVASEDSLSLLDEIRRSPHTMEKTSGYVPANKVHDDVGEPFLSSTYLRHAAYTHRD